MKYLSKNIYKGVNYGRISIMKLKIELPKKCRYIFLDYNNSWLNAQSTTKAEKYIRYNRLEIVGENVINDMYIVKVRKADSFL
jgi:hypothetical protein